MASGLEFLVTVPFVDFNCSGVGRYKRHRLSYSHVAVQYLWLARVTTLHLRVLLTFDCNRLTLNLHPYHDISQNDLPLYGNSKSP
jgi:hypothetical protein